MVMVLQLKTLTCEINVNGVSALPAHEGATALWLPWRPREKAILSLGALDLELKHLGMEVKAAAVLSPGMRVAAIPNVGCQPSGAADHNRDTTIPIRCCCACHFVKY